MSAPLSVSPHPDAIGAELAWVRAELMRMDASLARLAETDDAILALVSYTHLTLPTMYSVYSPAVSTPLKKK